MKLEVENRALDRLSKEKSQSCTLADRSEALVPKLACFYSVMGHRPDEPGALALMAEMLTQSGTDDQIDRAMTRCARECRYPVRLSDFLQRMPGQEIPELEAEGRKALEVVISFATKWVQSDPRGNYVISRGVRSSEPPKLSDRIHDTVRRTGGWKVYVCLNAEDFPFVQKRFFEEYEAWCAIEKVALPKLIREMPLLQLVAKPMDSPTIPKQTLLAQPVKVAAFKPKTIPQPSTDAQCRDHREMLRQQASVMAAKCVNRRMSGGAPLKGEKR